MSFATNLSFKRELQEAMAEDIARGGSHLKWEKTWQTIEQALEVFEARRTFIQYDEPELDDRLEAAKARFLSGR